MLQCDNGATGDLTIAIALSQSANTPMPANLPQRTWKTKVIKAMTRACFCTKIPGCKAPCGSKACSSCNSMHITNEMVVHKLAQHRVASLARNHSRNETNPHTALNPAIVANELFDILLPRIQLPASSHLEYSRYGEAVSLLLVEVGVIWFKSSGSA